MPKEIELKLAFSTRYAKFMQGDMAWLKHHDMPVPVVTKLYSIYYDTPDLKLKNSGCSLRLRRTGKTWVQTIKAGGHVVAGLHQHDEWEAPLPGAHPDFNLIDNPEIRQIFKGTGLRKTLQPIFTTRFVRRTHYLKLAQGSEIEFCFDYGKIIAGSKLSTICEIELELKSGNPAEIIGFANHLVDQSPFLLRLENTSKAERGYILYTGRLSPPVKATRVEITPDLRLNAALKVIIANCLNQLGRNEHGMLARSTDIEYLHQMRVALRRLRSAINLFYKNSSDSAVVSIRKNLKWLMQQLSPARDWDIFITETFMCIAPHFPEHPGFSLTLKTCQTLRKKYNKAARISISSRRYTKLILDIALWLEEIDQYSAQQAGNTNQHRPATSTSAKTSVTTFIADLHHQITATGKGLDTLDTDTLHALRICIKKQRYLSEFFYGLFPQKACKSYILLLSNLQNVLGSINDYANTPKFLNEIRIGKNKTAQQYEAIGIIYGWTVCCMLEKKKELEDAWIAFTKAKPFWENTPRP